MIIDHSREKLINAIIYFVKNTRYCHKIKLYKLLYFLDFTHYQEIGRNVTGLDYLAYKKGPFPIALAEEIETPKDDFLEKIQITQEPYLGGSDRLDITPLSEFDPSHFSKRELRILKSLAERFKKTPAKQMIEETHLENKPWHHIWEVEGKRSQAEIPYELAIKKQELQEMKALIKENQEFLQKIQ